MVNFPSTDLWKVRQMQPRYVWVGCTATPTSGHARQVNPDQVEEGVVCLACREPAFPLEPEAVEAYLQQDRRCLACRTDSHEQCVAVGCYGCPPELHRRRGQSQLGGDG